MSLADAFLEAVDPARRAAHSGADLAPALAAVVDTARAAWPAITVEPAQFVRWLAARLPPAGLAGLPAADLYLACACARGDASAIAAFEATYLREVDLAAARLRVSDALRDEARQVVRALLFVPRAEHPPAIATYSGRGDLRGWLRVIAARELVRLASATRREVALSDELVEAVSPTTDPELVLLKQRYREEFGHALREAIAALTPRERTLLSYHLLDGLGADEVGGIYDVHRATAARWLARAREALVLATRTRLAARLGLDAADAEVDSVIRLVRSRLDVSIRRALGRK